jgi:hypothetical protein
VLPSVTEDGNPATMKFSNIHHQLRAPFTIYADFESVLAPVSSAHPSPSTSSTTPTQQHVVCSASYVIVSWDGRFFRKPVLIRASAPNDDVVGEFLTRMQTDVDALKVALKKEAPMENLMSEQQLYLQSANAVCHICSKSFVQEEKRVRDHCHVTGTYRLVNYYYFVKYCIGSLLYRLHD